jgi:undecaprenyl-diphosphatase
MEIIQAIILGIVQGITEWLPVSSSAHLAIFQNLFHLNNEIFFDVILHLASALVLIVIFWKDILFVLNLKNKESRKYLLLIIIGSIPAAFVGFLFRSKIESFFTNLIFVGIFLIITGILLFITKFAHERKEKISFRNSFLIGISQAVALLPGISRSGSTIATGLLLGEKKKESARFAFLLAIPAILGAAFFEIYKNYSVIASPQISALLIGFVFSFLVGIVSIKFLLKIVQKGKLHYFSYYCLCLGILIIILSRIL